jgi:hypothetical protein
MRGHVPPRQNPGVDSRVQRLDAAVEHFRKAGVVGHLGNRNAAFFQQAGRAARGQQGHAKPGETAGEFNESGLVGNADQRGLDDSHGAGLRIREQRSRNLKPRAAPTQPSVLVPRS